MRRRRQFDTDRIAGPDLAAGQHDAHDAGLADQPAVVARPAPPPSGPAETCPAGRTGCAARSPRRPPSSPMCSRVPVGSASRSMPRVVMFSPISPGATSKPGCAQLVVQLGVDQVHLAQVGLGRIARDARAVLHRHAHVRVAFDAEPGQQRDAGAVDLLNVCPELRLTAVTKPSIGRRSIARESRSVPISRGRGALCIGFDRSDVLDDDLRREFRIAHDATGCAIRDRAVGAALSLRQAGSQDFACGGA